MPTLRIVSRNSPLALWQAQFVKQQLQNFFPFLEISILGLVTTGDKLLNQPLAALGGKGLFVKELEMALLNNEADIAVHSMKDVPYTITAGLMIPTILKREDPFDALICKTPHTLASLPLQAVIGTSSHRRRCQLLHYRPDLIIEDLRGNVDTRLKKLHELPLDAIVLATAGLKRLNLQHHIHENLAPYLLPAVGQGALGIECRTEDKAIEAYIAPLNDFITHQSVMAERAFNLCLKGNCQSPIAGFAEFDGNQLHLKGLVGDLKGQCVLRSNASGDLQNPQSLGQSVAEQLLKQGADKFLHL